MNNIFGNLKIGPKILAGYMVVLVLMTGVGGIALLRVPVTRESS